MVGVGGGAMTCPVAHGAELGAAWQHDDVAHISARVRRAHSDVGLGNCSFVRSFVSAECMTSSSDSECGIVVCRCCERKLLLLLVVLRRNFKMADGSGR